MSDIELLRVPFNEMVDAVKFNKLDDGSYDARVGETLVGEIVAHDAENKQVFAKWKSEVIKTLVRHCLTVELKTLCGCARYIESEQKHEITVPLRYVLRGGLDSSELVTTNQRSPNRLFRHHGKLNEFGFRIFEEVEPR